MTKTYVIADLHGRYDLLELAMRTIVHDISFFHSGDSIVTLGDYVDRGPQSRQIIKYLMAMQRDLAGSRLICLKGNHEDIMWQTCRKLPHPDWWLSNGGGATLLSYGHPKEGPINLKVVSLRASALDLVASTDAPRQASGLCPCRRQSELLS